MTATELLLTALALSMDAFAAAVCGGMAMKSATLKKAFIIGLYFGAFQAVMPLAGYFMTTWFADKITAFDHWIAFAMLSFIGGKMIAESLQKEKYPGKSAVEPPLNPARMLPLAVATSIDALAAGVTFALTGANIAAAVSLTGVSTLLLSMAGVKIGKIFNTRFKSAAEFTGGAILILMGVKILLQHTVLS